MRFGISDAEYLSIVLSVCDWTLPRSALLKIV